MKDVLRAPDVEVVVRCAGSDVADFAAWLDGDIHQGLQSVVAIEHPTSSKAVCAILQAAIQKIMSADWVALDVLDAFEAEEDGLPPF